MWRKSGGGVTPEEVYENIEEISIPRDHTNVAGDFNNVLGLLDALRAPQGTSEQMVPNLG